MAPRLTLRRRTPANPQVDEPDNRNPAVDETEPPPTFEDTQDSNLGVLGGDRTIDLLLQQRRAAHARQMAHKAEAEESPAEDDDADGDDASLVPDHQPEPSDPVYVAHFLPPETSRKLRRSQAGAQTQGNMHITLAHLGTVQSLGGPDRLEALHQAVHDFAMQEPPIAGRIGGYGRFRKAEMVSGDKGDVVYGHVDAPGLAAMQQRLTQHLASQGFDTQTQSDFTPHVSLGNVAPDQADHPWVDIPSATFRIDNLHVSVGATRSRYPMAGDPDQADPADAAGTPPPAAPAPPPAAAPAPPATAATAPVQKNWAAFDEQRAHGGSSSAAGEMTTSVAPTPAAARAEARAAAHASHQHAHASGHTQPGAHTHKHAHGGTTHTHRHVHGHGHRRSMHKFELEVPVWVDKADPQADEQRLIYGVVLVPDLPDSQGDVLTAADIEKAAHAFLATVQKGEGMGLLHEGDPVPELEPVESYIAPHELEIGGQRVAKGSWVLVSRANSEPLWKAAKGGLLSSYSMQGWGVRIPLKETA